LENIIALQDEITIEILTALNVTLLEGQQANSWIKGCTSNLEVYMKALKGLHHLRSQNKEENILARQLAKEALQIAPECSNLYVLLSHTYLMDVYFDPGSSMLSFAFATHNLKRALALDKNNHIVYISLATLYLFQNDYENAIAAGERAIILNPSGADAYNQLGLILCLSGQCEKAIEFHKKAIALNPYAPGAYFSQLGWAYYASKQHEEGIKTLEVSLKRNPLNIIAHLTLTYAYYKSGMETKARLQAIEVYKIDPDFNSETIHSWPMKNREILEEFIQTLRKTGIK
jgi:tetratricopeptide (TPR) repeat protein